MTDSPFLTVMVPVHDGEAYVADAIRSVLGQPCRDLELIVIDDGSTDGTLRVERSYAAQDPRVRVVSHPNWGIGRTRNEGLGLVRGECLIYLDDDDVLVPGFYADATRNLLRRLLGAGVDTVVTSRLHADESLSRAYLAEVPLEGLHPGDGPACLGLPYEFTTIIYRTALLRGNDVRFSEGFPEMESIFRHRAVFLSRNVLFTNDLHFMTRRDNPTQLTKTWDVGNVVRVRAERYRELLEWHVARGTTGEVLEGVRALAEQARAELDAWRPPAPEGPIRRIRRRRAERRDHDAWVAGMAPIGRYSYEGPEGERRLREALDRMGEAAGL